MNKIDLSGRRFGLWLVIKEVSGSRNRHIYYICRCDCGNEKYVSSSHLRYGKTKSCGCNRRKGRRHKQWRGCGDISGNFWDSITRGANGSKGRCPIEMDLTIKQAWDLFLKQEKKCALTGIPLVINYQRKTGEPHTASLDRIDSSIGYTLSNVQWVHKDINRMKNTFTQEHFIEMCKKVSGYAKIQI